MATGDSWRDDLTAVGLSAGLDRVGVATATPFVPVRLEMERRVAEGMSAGLGFTFKDPEKATDVSRSFGWASRLVVGSRSYLPEAGVAPTRPGHGRVARFAIDDPYPPLQAGLEAMAGWLRGRGRRAEVLVDDDRLVDRAAAVRAGVAWWGKSTMALAPGLGPWFVLGSVVTDADIEPTPPMRRTCGTCQACLPACPTGALVAPGVLDARRCLAAIAQTGGVIPRRWRKAMGDRLYGCDDCLDACPPGIPLVARSTRERGSVDLRWIMEASDDELVETFSHFYIPRRSARYLRRNALVAMGNDGDPGLAAILTDHVSHPDWLLRAHAVWALARTVGERARPLLTTRLGVDDHEEVRAELRAELAMMER